MMGGHRWEKGHPGYFKGKPMDPEKFIEGYTRYYVKREINMRTFAKIAGISEPTLRSRLRELFTDGRIAGHFFTNGKEMAFDFTGLPPEQASAWQTLLETRRKNAENG